MPFLDSLGVSDVLAGQNPFPVYKCLEKNVAFWKKVFTQYNTRQGIIHDRRDLSIIYGVIKLRDRNQHGAGKINKNRIKKAKEKYQRILKKLSRGGPPSSGEEKRIAGLFGAGAARHIFRKAGDNIRCQVGQKDRFREGLIRSGAFMDQIKDIFRSYGLPPDLAYMPHVESSFNLNAYSKFGAAGIWQFMRSTGKRYLEIGYTLDERRDPIRASHAAARLLKENYKTLGSWSLAITAYNHGAAGMMRAKRSKGSYPAIFKHYRSRLFRFASRNFYSEFLAARHVAKNYRKYFGKLEIHKPFRGHEIALAGYLPVKDLIGHYNFDIATIKVLNPSLREPVYNGQKYIPKGYLLRLPHEAGKGKKGPLNPVPSHLYKHKQKRSLFHRVRKGDTAGKIAKVHGVSLSELKFANHLNSRATIYVGQNLRLPAPDEKRYRLAKAKKPGKKDKVSGRRVISKSKIQVKPKPQVQVTRKPVTVEPPREISKKMPPINVAVVTGNLPVEKVRIRNGRPIGTIRVVAAETLGHYADWLGVATQEIRRINGFRYGRMLRLDEPVKIPLDNTSRERFEERRFEYHKEIEEDFFDSYRVENIEIYKVKRGDTIWKLCEDVFEVPLWLIIKYNPQLKFNSLQPIQEVLVPVVEEKAMRG